MWRQLLLTLAFSLHVHCTTTTSDEDRTNKDHVYSFTGEGVSEHVLTRKGGGEKGDNYGLGVATCGRRAFVGSYSDSFHYTHTGTVYVYTLAPTSSSSFSSSSTTTSTMLGEGVAEEWVLEDKLHPTYSSADVYFGWSLACQGNSSLAVGAYGDNSLGIQKAGAVYLYSYVSASYKGSGGWEVQGIFYSVSPQEHEYFGWDVALDDNLLVVSAIGNADLYTACGVVYVYKYNKITLITRRMQEGDTDENVNNDHDDGYMPYVSKTPDGWDLESVIAPADPYAYMNFGWSVSLYDQSVVVSAPWMFARRGVVYVYSRGLTENSAYDDLYYMDEGEYAYTLVSTVYSGTLTDDSDLFEADSKSYFGYSVAIDDDLIVIGHHLGHTYSKSNGEMRRTGRVFVCRLEEESSITTSTRSVTMIADLGEIVEDRIDEFSFFGYDVSIAGRTIVVGAPGDIHTNSNTSVFVFTAKDSSRNDWTLTQHWRGRDYAPYSPDLPSDQLEPTRFGIATSINEEGNLVFVSDNNGMSVDYIQTGRVYAWIGILYDDSNDTQDMSISTTFWIFSVFVVSMSIGMIAIVSKRRRPKLPRSDLDDILGDEDESILMAIGTGDDSNSSSEFVRTLLRYGSLITSSYNQIWSRNGMEGVQMARIPTESIHGDDSGDQGSRSSASTVDSRKLIATAQAVADDDNHPNHEEVAELIRSYKREWINTERFQKEFQRLIF